LSQRVFVAIGLPVLLISALGGLFFSGILTTRAVQNPSIALDMLPTTNTYDSATNTMSVGTTENCLTTATGNNLTHVHPAQLIIQNVEDLIAWQARFNYLGDQMRPTTVTFAPFTDSNTGQNISFVNLPIDSTALIHRDQVTALNIPAAAPGPQTAIIAASYLGTQTFPISPDTPAKSVPDDTSYSAANGGVLATVFLQVLAGNAGNPSLFMNLDDGSPNSPDSRAVVFNGTGTTDISIPVSQLGDGYHGEGTACTPLDCVTQECPPVSSSTPTASATPTSSATPTATPTVTPTSTPKRTPPVVTPPHRTPRPH
jgi:hypothetical protein